MNKLNGLNTITRVIPFPLNLHSESGNQTLLDIPLEFTTIQTRLVNILENQVQITSVSEICSSKVKFIRINGIGKRNAEKLENLRFKLRKDTRTIISYLNENGLDHLIDNNIPIALEFLPPNYATFIPGYLKEEMIATIRQSTTDTLETRIQESFSMYSKIYGIEEMTLELTAKRLKSLQERFGGILFDQKQIVCNFDWIFLVDSEISHEQMSRLINLLVDIFEHLIILPLFKER